MSRLRHALNNRALTIALALACVAAVLAPLFYGGQFTASGRGVTDFGTGSLPLQYEPGAPFEIDATARIRIVGDFGGARPAPMVLRVEDDWAPTPEQRFERIVEIAPGPFELEIAADELIAGDGALNLADLKRVVLFTYGDEPVTITRFGVGEEVARAGPVEAIDFGGGVLPVRHRYDWSPLDMSGLDEIYFEGVAETDGKMGVALFIEDSASTDYATRYNFEFELTDGPFSFRKSLGGMRTPSGRTIDRRAIRRVVVGPFSGEGEVTLTKLIARPGPKLPGGAVGYAFGARDAGLPPGFERIGPNDPRVSGATYVVTRPAPDPLVANGVGNVDAIRLTETPPGRYLVTIWVEDPGEWELLPHPLRRRVVANGVTLLDTDFTPQEWIERRYLSGAGREHGLEDDAWTAYGQFRGERRSAVVEVGADGLVLEFFGDSPAARYISALLIEPAGSEEARAFVQAERAQWYRTNYDLDPDWRARVEAATPGAYRIEIKDGALSAFDPDGAPATALKAVAAPGGAARVTVELHVDVAGEAAIDLTPLQSDGAVLDAMLWTGQWRLQRHAGYRGKVMGLLDDMLLPGGAATLSPDLPRRFEIWISAPENAAPGAYLGAFEIDFGAGAVSAPVEIELLDVALPEAADSVGFYSFEAPHLAALASDPRDRQRQIACDLDFLIGFDLFGTAPVVRPARPGNTEAMFLDLRRGVEAGLTQHSLAYNPLLHMQVSQEPEIGAALIAEVEARLKAIGAPGPNWSIADELHNPGNPLLELFWPWIEALRAASPGIKLAGHLNSPRDVELLDAFDTVIVNEGYGVDLATLASLKERGLDVWIYNASKPRVAAGLWLWASEATRYQQWHARNPSADPYDPLDSHHSDHQALPPIAEICAEQPPIDRLLLRVADGVQDQRWLLWLDAQEGAEASALKAELRAAAAEGVDAVGGEAEMIEMRRKITDLARAIQ